MNIHSVWQKNFSKNLPFLFLHACVSGHLPTKKKYVKSFHLIIYTESPTIFNIISLPRNAQTPSFSLMWSDPVPKLSSPQSDKRWASIRFPKNFQPNNIHEKIMKSWKNCTWPTSSCNFVAFEKFILAYYTKLHSKSCYNLSQHCRTLTEIHITRV